MRKSNVKLDVVDESGSKHDLQLFYDAYTKYLRLSRYLFSGEEFIYDINEMPGDSDFFTDAVRIAEQLKIDWEHMSYEDSNRIMLALLEDYYQTMAKVANKKKLEIEIKLKIVK